MPMKLHLEPPTSEDELMTFYVLPRSYRHRHNSKRYYIRAENSYEAAQIAQKQLPDCTVWAVRPYCGPVVADNLELEDFDGSEYCRCLPLITYTLEPLNPKYVF